MVLCRAASQPSGRYSPTSFSLGSATPAYPAHCMVRLSPDRICRCYALCHTGAPAPVFLTLLTDGLVSARVPGRSPNDRAETRVVLSTTLSQSSTAAVIAVPTPVRHHRLAQKGYSYSSALSSAVINAARRLGLLRTTNRRKAVLPLGRSFRRHSSLLPMRTAQYGCAAQSADRALPMSSAFASLARCNVVCPTLDFCTL